MRDSLSKGIRRCRPAAILLLLLAVSRPLGATPANRASFTSYYGRFLPKKLDNCATCHRSLKPGENPTSLADFPHNPFGRRIAELGIELRKVGKKADIPTRVRIVAAEDSDGDGIDNQTEIVLGHSPGDPKDRPTAKELASAGRKRTEFARYLSEYRWRPFDPVNRPAIPKVQNAAWIRNPIDAFVSAEHESRGLKPRPEAPRNVLLRRVYLDLIGLTPTPEELRAFELDRSLNAYEKVVDRLLVSPRYGERWGRHWMDVWRYSDWAGWSDGGQIRDSKPFIWRWRDWIVESLNRDKGYDRMALEMLAADELCPEDTDALRATGFLVRNFKLLSREQWMEDVVNHTSRAFMGVTMHCAKCHNHMFDPITQEEYYRLRAIFEPHNVRTDRIPGQPDTSKDGLVHAFDSDPKVATYFFSRGDERNPDKSRAITPGVPSSLGGALAIQPVKLPRLAYLPDRREFVIQETVAASEKAVADAKNALEQAPNQEQAKLQFALSESRHAALLAVLDVEKIEDSGDKESETWKQAAATTVIAQRKAALLEAKLNRLAAQKAVDEAQKADPKDGKAAATLEAAKKKLAEAQKAVTTAEKEMEAAPTPAYKPRITNPYPAESTGRRLAFARWLVDKQNPLAARVAMNQIWMRHFGEGIVPTVDNFGRHTQPPTMPKLLDWLAAEFMNPTIDDRRWTMEDGGSIVQHQSSWSMKRMHRLIVTSSAYRQASTPEPIGADKDPDNRFLWRFSSRRMEAEVVRDNLLHVGGNLDLTMGGAEIDHNQGLVSKRRSIYLRIAAEKEVEFLKQFDSPSVTECYMRKQSVMPQQALALANSELAIAESRILARSLYARVGYNPPRFIEEAFLRILSRRPTEQEMRLCAAFLADQARRSAKPSGPIAAAAAADSGKPSADPILHARENLILVLLNHNDFVTIR